MSGWAAAAGAAAQLGEAFVGAGMNLAGGRLQYERQLKLNAQAARLNYQYGKMAGDDAQQRSIDLYGTLYSPKAMIAQGREAGVNPVTMIGGSGGFNPTSVNSPAAYSGVGGGNAAMATPGNAIRGTAMGMMDALLMQKQLKDIDAGISVKEAEAGRLSAEEDAIRGYRKENTEIDTALKESQIRVNEATGENVKVKTLGEELNNEFARRTLEDRVVITRQEYEANVSRLAQYAAEARSAILDADFKEATYSTRFEALGVDLRNKIQELAIQHVMLQAHEKGVELTGEQVKIAEEEVRKKSAEADITEKDARWYTVDKIFGYVESIGRIVTGVAVGKALGGKAAAGKASGTAGWESSGGGY